MRKRLKPDNLDRVGAVPNNPRFDKIYGGENSNDARAIAKSKEQTLYDDTLNRIASKREPGEPRKTEYLKVDKKQFDKDMKVWKQRSNQSLARDRLKKKGAVPTKAGKKLFEDFIKEANLNRERKFNRKTLEDLQNIYNAGQHLDFDRWKYFISTTYPTYF